jgi:hypothetical protein
MPSLNACPNKQTKERRGFLRFICSLAVDVLNPYINKQTNEDTISVRFVCSIAVDVCSGGNRF